MKKLTYLSFLVLALLAYHFVFSSLPGRLRSPARVASPGAASAEIPADSPFVDPGLTDPFSPEDVKHLRIDIERPHAKKLAEKRKQAFEVRYLITEADDYVPGTVSVDGKQANVRLRLKGDFLDHIKGFKWSFRIKVRGNNTVLGMKVFSIHHPKLRKYLDEWVYHRMMRQEDVISLRYDFVKVTLNGNYLGLYALEEHFEKRLIEKNRRREGPIVKFDESPLWAAFRDRKQDKTKDVDGPAIFMASSILPFRKTRIREDPQQFGYYEKAVTLLENLRRRRLNTSEVFDTEKLARYYAVSHLLGATHGNRWHNVRYYYNPVTSRLEPIAFDGVPRNLRETGGAFRSKFFDYYNKLIFSDVEFAAAYFAVVNRITGDGYLEGFLSSISSEYEEKLNILKKEFADYTHSLEYLEFNREYLRTAPDYLDPFNVYHVRSTGDSLVICYANDSVVPVQILSLSNERIHVELGDEYVVFPHARTKDPHLYIASYGVSDPGFRTDDLQVTFRVPGSGIERTKPVLYDLDRLSDRLIVAEWPPAFVDATSALSLERRDLMRRPPNPQAFAFLKVDEISKTIQFQEGTWEIHENMIVPAGYRMIVPRGTRLRLYDSANIISFSPVELRGTEGAPIVVEAPDSTGQGFAVIDSNGESSVAHTIFRNLTSPFHMGWDLQGALSFYESPVVITDSQFLNSRSEDALNIVRSIFGIENCNFIMSHADALDIDFSEGYILASRFEDCGNDGVDLSGSTVKLSQSVIRDAGDKALSAGEASNVELSDVATARCTIGIASKDRSVVRAEDVEIRLSKIGISVYQKKPEFGPARVEAAQLLLDDIDLKFLIEKGSSVIMDGQNVIGSGQKKTKLVLRRIKNGQSIN